jgi:hypothetical protein
MSIEASVRATDQSAEKKVSDGINRAYQIYGPNLTLFFSAVAAEIKTGDQKAAVQMDLPLTKSR